MVTSVFLFQLNFINLTPKSRFRGNRAKHLARVAAEYTQLLYHAGKARAEKCKFVDEIQWVRVSPLFHFLLLTEICALAHRQSTFNFIFGPRSSLRSNSNIIDRPEGEPGNRT